MNLSMCEHDWVKLTKCDKCRKCGAGRHHELEHDGAGTRWCKHCDLMEWFDEGQWWPLPTEGERRCEGDRR